MKKTIPLVLALTALSAAAFADEAVVKQENKQFSVSALKLKVGDTIVFVNDDPFVHNVFSLSDAQTFDLGTFGKGQSRQVKLEKPGKLEVECAVHPEMKLTVEVAP